MYKALDTRKLYNWTGSDYEEITGGDGSGDMVAATYDPDSIAADTFDMDNMKEGTAKILTADERAAIADNTSKVGITTEQSDAIVANTAKTGITTEQANDITANNAKTGITTQQADDITANNAKRSYPSEDETKLAGIADGAEVNVKPDWDAAAGADDEILNKPTTMSVVEADIVINKATTDTIAAVQNLLNAQPKNLNGFNLYIRSADGSHNWGNDILDTTKFYNGRVILEAATMISAQGTNQNAIWVFDGSGYLKADNNYLNVDYAGIHVQWTATGTTNPIQMSGNAKVTTTRMYWNPSAAQAETTCIYAAGVDVATYEDEFEGNATYDTTFVKFVKGVQKVQGGKVDIYDAAMHTRVFTNAASGVGSAIFSNSDGVFTNKVTGGAVDKSAAGGGTADVAQINTPSITSITASGGTFNCTANRAGHILWSVRLTSAGVPTKTEIAAGTDSIDYDSVVCTANVAITDTITGGAGTTQYTAWAFSTDGNGNESEVKSVVFTTDTADTTAPTLVSATVENAAPTNMVLVFDEDVTGTNLGFSISGTTSTAFSSISISGHTITGVLADAVAHGETILLSYDAATGDITDTATTPNDLASITDFAVTNNVADTVAPVATFNPANGATNVAIDGNITITYDEAVRNTNGTEITDTNADALITLKEDDTAGADIAFDATINAGKTVITVNPDSDLSNSQDVYVAVAAVEDSSGNENTASNVTFTTIAAGTGLVAPTLNSLVASDGVLAASWDDPNTTETGYEVNYREDGDTVWIVAATVAAGVTSYNIGSLTNETDYDVMIVAVDGTNREESNIETEAPTDLTKLNTPTNFAITNIGWHNFSLEYDDTNTSPNESGILIAYKENGVQDWRYRVGLVDSTAQSVIDLDPDLLYQLKIKATGDGTTTADSLWSTIITGTTDTVTLIASVLSAPTMTSTSASLSFTDTNSNPNETGVEIYYRVNGTTPWTLSSTEAADALTAQITGLTAGEDYDFMVKPVSTLHGVLETPDSNIVTATAEDKLATPELTGVVMGVSTADLTFTDPNTTLAEDGTEVYYRAYGGTTWILDGTTAANATTHQITGLSATTSYEYMVRAVSSTYVDSEDSNILIGTTTGATAAMSFQTDYNGTLALSMSPAAGTLRWKIDGTEYITNSLSHANDGTTVDVDVYLNDVVDGVDLGNIYWMNKKLIGTLDFSWATLTDTLSIQISSGVTSVLFRNVTQTVKNVYLIALGITAVDFSDFSQSAGDARKYALGGNGSLASIEQPTFSTGLYDYDVNGGALPVSEVDEIFSSLNTFFSSNTPTRDLDVDTSGGTNGSPTSGSSNTDIANLVTLFNNAGHTFTYTIN
jgi:hypothetical protein